jgi:hypothetical protein
VKTVSVQVQISRSPDVCFERFCQLWRLPEWVPGLRQATPLSGAGELPAEVEFSTSDVDGRQLIYSLRYAYDRAQWRVAWMPGAGADEAVRGMAAFAAEEGVEGCVMTYALEVGAARRRSLDEVRAEAEAVAGAFKRWVEACS